MYIYQTCSGCNTCGKGSAEKVTGALIITKNTYVKACQHLSGDKNSPIVRKL